MKRMLKWTAIGLGALIGLICVLASALIATSAIRQLKTYHVPADQLVLHAAPDRARGEHLATTMGCTACHGHDLGGTVLFDNFPMGRFTARNISRGGVGAEFTTADYVRAIRYGVVPTGRSLVFMPSDAFEHLSDADLASIIDYVQSMPAVSPSLPPTRIGPLARILHATAHFPLLSAEETEPDASHTMPAPSDTVAYGQYLANSAGCTGCHGRTLAGNAAPGPPNLTRGGPTAAWTEADFLHALHDGKRPDGTGLSDNMPWKVFGHMTDAELISIWRFLRSVPPISPPAK
jgi:cytochrome c553